MMLDHFDLVADVDSILDYDINQTRKAFIEQTLAQGLRIVYPAANELQVDIDSEAHLYVFTRSWECLLRNWDENYLPLPTCSAHDSRSGYPRQHITVTLPFNVDPWQRIALQAALGSDPLRELLSSIRFMRGDESPTLFVESGE